MYIQVYSISYLFNYIIYFLQLFFFNNVSYGFRGKQMSLFCGTIKEYLF